MNRMKYFGISYLLFDKIEWNLSILLHMKLFILQSQLQMLFISISNFVMLKVKVDTFIWLWIEYITKYDFLDYFVIVSCTGQFLAQCYQLKFIIKH